MVKQSISGEITELANMISRVSSILANGLDPRMDQKKAMNQALALLDGDKVRALAEKVDTISEMLS